MFYNRINNPKIMIYKMFINCFLIVAYMISFCSCTTMGLHNVPPDSLEPGTANDIKKIELKNGTVIDCAGKIIRIERESDSSVVFVIASNRSSKTTTTSVENATKLIDTRIPEEDVKTIITETSKADSGMTTLALAGGIALVIVIVALISNDSSYPFP